MQPEDTAVEKIANIVMDVYRYMNANNLDITSADDVTKALTVLNLSEAKDLDVEVLIQGLVALDKMTKDFVAKKQSEGTGSSN